jgi:hypothetical protein
MGDFMRIQIASLLTIFILTTTYAGDDIRFVPERLTFSEWIGKNIGGGIGSSISQMWHWVTDARYNGLTQLRRAGALGCFFYAGGRYAADTWNAYRRGRALARPQGTLIGLTILGILLAASPQVAYESNAFASNNAI